MKRKLLFSIISLIIYHSLYGQDIPYTKEKIDSIVNKINTTLSTKHRSFNLEKHYKVGKTYTEKWVYLRDAKNLFFFRINYTIDSTDYEEEYYLDQGELVYATESEVMRFPSFGPDDLIVWSGVFYFSRKKLIYQSTLGHGKSEIDGWDPEKETLIRYSKRRYKRLELLTWSK